MKPLITALVDTYNHEKYIEQAIASVLEQGLSATELEIVVVDDGSTDKTPEWIRKFTPRAKHLRKKNGGQASAFNAGFAESRGEIIATLDGDDWWARGKLAAVIAALEQNPTVAAVGHGHYEFHSATGETRPCVPPARTLLNLSTPETVGWWRFLLPSALTVRRKVFDWITPIPEDMVYMADSALQAAATVMGTLILPEPLFYYRFHPENFYAIDSQNAEKFWRRSRMAEIAYSGVSRQLLDRGVPADAVSALLGAAVVEATRANLSHFGGTRRKAFETEMQAFHLAFKNPSLAYRLYKYLVVGPATLLLPPRRFYRIRNWYAQRQLGRHRDRLFPGDITASRD